MKILRKKNNDGPDLWIVEELGSLIAVQEYVPKPIIMPKYEVISPIYWYARDELMTFFDLEDTDA